MLSLRNGYVMTPDTELLNVLKQVTTALNVPMPVLKTFEALLKAHLLNETCPPDDLFVATQDEQVVRNRISHLRHSLRGVVFLLPDRKYHEFEIPDGRPYKLSDASTAAMSRLWTPHKTPQEDVLIHTYERLFFRYKTVYIRDVRVNRKEELDKIAEFLNRPGKDLTPSMHYVSSGEIQAAIATQSFLHDYFGKHARLSAGTEFSGNRENLILLGAARVDAPDLDPPRYEKFKVHDSGVKPGFRDKVEKDEHRTVHVLMSRRSGHRNSIQTVFESGHGRAMQGVCAALCDRNGDLCASVINKLGVTEKALPSTFQVVYRVGLMRSSHIAQAKHIEVVAAQCY